MFGDRDIDEQLRKTWHDFCEHLKASGDLIFRNATPRDATTRATGLRLPARNIALGMQFEMESGGASAANRVTSGFCIKHRVHRGPQRTQSCIGFLCVPLCLLCVLCVNIAAEAPPTVGLNKRSVSGTVATTLQDQTSDVRCSNLVDPDGAHQCAS